MGIIKKQPMSYDLTNLTIMVVEDSAYMSSLISSMLKIFSVGDIMECTDCHEAIEVLTVTQARSKSRFVTHVDVILTDWLMPSGSGQTLLDWVRSHPSDDIRFMPVIIVSGYTTQAIIHDARDHGANDTLVKPISANGLASRICSIIETPRVFVKSPNYFGPDRRRQTMPYKGEERRLMKTKTVTIKKGQPV